jgi:hypothetical protein
VKAAFNIFCAFVWIIVAVTAVHDWWFGIPMRFSVMFLAVGGTIYVLLDRLESAVGKHINPPEGEP